MSIEQYLISILSNSCDPRKLLNELLIEIAQLKERVTALEGCDSEEEEQDE